jgi:hypothetical protein
MTPADFRVYDVLNCCATAVSEAAASHRAKAMAAWIAAGEAASAMSGPVSAALGVIVTASAPSRASDPRRPALQRALDAASVAALLVRNGDTGIADMALADACDYTAKVPQSEAFGTVLAALWDVSRAEVAA